MDVWTRGPRALVDLVVCAQVARVLDHDPRLLALTLAFAFPLLGLASRETFRPTVGLTACRGLRGRGARGSVRSRGPFDASERVVVEHWATLALVAPSARDPMHAIGGSRSSRKL